MQTYRHLQAFTRQVINVGKVRNIGHNLLVSVNAIKT